MNGYPSVPSEFSNSQAVVIATVVAEKPAPQTEDVGGTMYTVRVEKQFRGRPSPTLELFDENSSGRFDMTVGTQYLLFIYQDNGRMVVDNCGNSGVLSKSGRALRQVEKCPRAIELEARFERALASPNEQVLDSVLADDAVVIASNAERLNKTDFTSRMTGNTTHGIRMYWFGKFDDNERKVISTDGVVVVVGKGKEAIELCFEDSPNSPCSGVSYPVYLSTAWVHTSNGWQVVFCQATSSYDPSNPTPSRFTPLESK